MRRLPSSLRALAGLTVAAALACQVASPAAPSATATGTPSAAAVASPTATPVPTPSVSYPAREGSCAMRVTGSFTLANDLTCEGDGMVIVADNVTVDLGGHTLTGPGMG